MEPTRIISPRGLSSLRASRRPAPDANPPRDCAGYQSTALRHPREPLILAPHTLSELTGPVYGYDRIGPIE